MSTVEIAKQPDLSFLLTSKRKNEINACSLPLILKKNGKLDWAANAYLTEYGGGPNVFNIQPLATTVEKKAYSLNIFCTLLETEQIKLSEINDSTLYLYVKSLKERYITDATIISHVRVALGYIVYLTKKNSEWNLSTSEKIHNNKYRVHYTVETYKSMRIEKSYLSHRCLKGLIHISTEAEFIHDYEYVKWLDAINCTSFHPVLNNLLISRWQALATLLEITGSRISEAHQITRTMVKNASKFLMDNTAKHVLRDIPINKGKYKGKTRQIPVSKEDLQVILWYIALIEQRFPKMKHDAIFVDVNTGKQLKSSYLKNYAKKVINNSPYGPDLRHVTNHSFRHRFITLHIAKAINKISKYGSFPDILTVAANACRKLTMHASNTTLSHYIHLATDINDDTELDNSELCQVPTQIRIRLQSMLNITEKLHSRKISENEALKSILSTLDEFQKYNFDQN